MDRDTVRLIVIGLGVLLLAGMYIWAGIRSSSPGRRSRRRGDDPAFDEDDGAIEDFLLDEEDSRNTHGEGHPDEASGTAAHFPDEDEETETGWENSVHQSDGDQGMPSLLQISVIAGQGRFFDGPELKQALLDADLLHGDMDIFHRYDRDYKNTLFSVASYVEPGTFPIDDMDDFQCPGIVLFCQTATVPSPLHVYNDMVETSRELVNRLHGIAWDETRKPLTAHKISHMRGILQRTAKEKT